MPRICGFQLRGQVFHECRYLWESTETENKHEVVLYVKLYGSWTRSPRTTVGAVCSLSQSANFPFQLSWLDLGEPQIIPYD